MTMKRRGRLVRDLEDAGQLLSKWRASGKTLAAWCSDNKINVYSLAAFKRNLERKQRDKTDEDVDFVEVKLLPPSTTADYQIDLANGHTIRFDDRFSPDRLREILALVTTC